MSDFKYGDHSQYASPTPSTYYQKSLNINSPHNEPSYKQLQFRYRSLEHLYGILQKEYDIYARETYNKIINLQKDIDDIVEQKDKIIKNIYLENKNIKQENLVIKKQINSIHQDVDKINYKVNQKQNIIKNSIIDYQQLSNKYQQLLLAYKQQMLIKNNEIQHLKQLLNSQKICNIAKDQFVGNKENQILAMIQQIKILKFQLDSQKSVQYQIKNSNFQLKIQVQELRKMFAQMESGLRNCQQCKFLHCKNMELQAMVKGHKQRQSLRQNMFLSIKKNNKVVERVFDPPTAKRQFIKNCFNQTRISNVSPFQPTGLQMRQIKQSVVRKCRSIIEHY